jgi:hypothetical protein
MEMLKDKIDALKSIEQSKKAKMDDISNNIKAAEDTLKALPAVPEIIIQYKVQEEDGEVDVFLKWCPEHKRLTHIKAYPDYRNDLSSKPLIERKFYEREAALPHLERLIDKVLNYLRADHENA